MPAVWNKSTIVTDAEVAEIVTACDVQMKRDFAPAHELRAWELVFARPKYINIYVVDDEAGVEGALAYHDYDGRPVGVVLAKTIKDYASGDWLFGPHGVSVALSHEYLETRLDPFCNDLGDGYWKEVCDAVQDYSYPINDVYVSDFCTKYWWTQNSPGPWDFLERLPHAQAIGTGGYQVHYDLQGEKTVWGEKPPYHGWRSLSRD